MSLKFVALGLAIIAFTACVCPRAVEADTIIFDAPADPSREYPPRPRFDQHDEEELNYHGALRNFLETARILPDSPIAAMYLAMTYSSMSLPIKAHLYSERALALIRARGLPLSDPAILEFLKLRVIILRQVGSAEECEAATNEIARIEEIR